jgi:outer membrane receptor protein involved in Fe transport
MIEDGVVLNQRQGPFFIPTNAGERKYNGFEVGGGWSASSAVSVYANAGFYHHRYSDFTIESEDGDTVLDDNRLEMSPDHIINWGAIVRPVPAISATFDVKHVGGVMVDPENTFELESYSLVDASVSWQVRVPGRCWSRRRCGSGNRNWVIGSSGQLVIQSTDSMTR